MAIETLQVYKSDKSLELTGAAPSACPSVPIKLGKTLLVEIDITQKTPIRILTSDYLEDRIKLRTILGSIATEQIDNLDTGDGAIPCSLTENWELLVDLASQQWNLDWNPLPLDSALLALDLLRAQHESIHLTERLPDSALAKIAFPAAQTLQRLLDANVINAAARSVVSSAINAVHINAPLGHVDTNLYTLPSPVSLQDVTAILQDAPIRPEAIATGSPDWRLTGHGVVSTAENSIWITDNIRAPQGITISAPVKPGLYPAAKTTYDALITDPETMRLVAVAVLRHDPTTRMFVGHTTPIRRILNNDFVDIRDPQQAGRPALMSDRAVAQIERRAVRDFVGRFITLGPISRLLQDERLVSDKPVLETTALEIWLELRSEKPTGVRGSSTLPTTNEAIRLSVSDEDTGMKIILIGSLGRPWVLRFINNKSKDIANIRILWSSGQETNISVKPNGPSIQVHAPNSNDIPRKILIEN